MKSNGYILDVRRIDLKCGINNGPAYVHYFNTPTRNSVNLLGPTLNFASRLEGIAEEDEIIVSKDLRNMIEDKYELRRKRIPEDDKIKSYEEVDVVYVLEGKKRRLDELKTDYESRSNRYRAATVKHTYELTPNKEDMAGYKI